MKDLGGKLYAAVFQDELRDILLRSLSLTGAPGAGLRLRLADAQNWLSCPGSTCTIRGLN